MLLLEQTLFQGILWYMCAFIFTVVFIIAGCLLGAFARKKKDAKEAMNAAVEVNNEEK